MKRLSLSLLLIFLGFSSWAQLNKDWATYYGAGYMSIGLNSKAVNIVYDSTGFIYVSGLTSDTNMATPNAYKIHPSTNLTPGGFNASGYIAKFDTLGNRIWATYLGNPEGAGIIMLPLISLDPAGNLVVTGVTSGITNIIGTPGTFQPDFPIQDTSGSIPVNGTINTYLQKFNSNGQLLWGTYLPPTNRYENHDVIYPLGITTDQSGNILISGTVGGSLSPHFIMPSSGSTYMPVTTQTNASLATLLKFDPTGNLVWGTYYGGNGSEADNGQYVVCDSNDNIYMVGFTSSDTGIASPGAAYPNLSAPPGSVESYIVKFDSNGARIWGTYTNGLIIRGGIALNNQEELYLAGFTNKDTGIATSGTYQTNRSGLLDITLSKWSSTGERIWGTYYGGPSYEDIVGTGDTGQISYAQPFSMGLASSNLSLDASGNPLIVGGTQSLEGIQLGCTYYPFPGVENRVPEGFMAKFYPDGQLMWGSYYESRLNGVASSNSGNSFYTISATDKDSLSTPGAFLEQKIIGAASTLITKMSGTYECPVITMNITDDSGILSIDPGYNTIQWYLNGNPVAGANNREFQPTDTGTYWVTFKNECGCPYTSSSYLVTQIPNGPTGIGNEAPVAHNIKVYPNPTTGSVWVLGNLSENINEVSISVFDVLGRLQYQSKIKASNGAFSATIDLSALGAGIYSCQIKGRNEVESVRLIRID